MKFSKAAPQGAVFLRMQNFSASAIVFIYFPHAGNQFVPAAAFPYNGTNFTFSIPEGGPLQCPAFFRALFAGADHLYTPPGYPGAGKRERNRK